MSISSISDIYRSLYASLVNKTTSTEKTTEDSSSSGTSNLTDVLDLGSSETDLSAYLNYNASGSYSGSSSLVDYLSSDDGSVSQSAGYSLIDALNSENGDGSTSSMFDCLINTKSKEIDNLISASLAKYSSNETEAEKDNTNS